MNDVNYYGTLNAVAEDCPVAASIVPALHGGKKTVAVIQYELLSGNPYECTSADVLFESSMRHKGLTPAEVRARRKELWAEFFSKPQVCLRASPLPKKYGWGLHCDERGRVALCALESSEYRRLVAGGGSGVKVVKAMRSSRAAR